MQSTLFAAGTRSTVGMLFYATASKGLSNEVGSHVAE